MPAGHRTGSDTGNGARISNNVRVVPNPAPANVESSASVAPSTQHVSVPPPWSATCAAAASTSIVVTDAFRTSGSRTSPAVQADRAPSARGEMQVRTRVPRRNRPNRLLGARDHARWRRPANCARRLFAPPRSSAATESRHVAKPDGSTRVSASVVTAQGYSASVAVPRGARARAAAVVETLAELYPDARCALDARQRIPAARRDDTFGAVH